MNIFDVVTGVKNQALQFDPTPGFNINAHAGGGIPFVSATGGSGQAPKSTSSFRPQGETTVATNTPSPTSPPNNNAVRAASAATSYDPAAVAAFDFQIGNAQTGIDRLGNQQAIGKQNVLDAYNTAYNKLLNQKALAERNYDTQKTQATQDNITAKNQINVGVGQAANSLSRLLGSHGSGNSSAVGVGNYAAALQGTRERQQVGQTFGRNQQALDTNWNDYSTEVQNSQGDLAHDRDKQINSLQSSVAANKASLLGQLANLQAQKAQAQGKSYAQAMALLNPAQAQINQLLTQSDNLGREYANPVLQSQDVAYKAPTLDQYQYDQAAAPTASNLGAYSDTISPYFAQLLGRRDDKQGAF